MRVWWLFYIPEHTYFSAINATQVEVKFSVELDKVDAQTKGKYTIGTTNPSTAELQKDNKTVKLTFTNPNEVEVTDAVLVVNPVKTKADTTKTTAKFTKIFTYEDKVKPEIVSVESKTSGNIATSVTVKASEPISAAQAKIDGEYVNINFGGTDTATITGLELDATKSHTLEVINLTDGATTPNVTVLTSKTFNIVKDVAAPTVSISTKSEKEILLTFDKPMNVATVESAFTASKGVKDEILETVSTFAVSGSEVDTDDTQFVIKIDASLFTNKDSRTLTIAFPESITDKLGNKIVATSKTVTLTKDTTKPAPVDYKIIKDSDGKVTNIEVYFSEGLLAATPAVPTIVNENGVAETSFLGGLTAQAITAGDKKVVYTASTPAEISGKYAFSFAKDLVSDLAETANKSDAFNHTFDFGAGETAFELPATGQPNAPTATGNVITVTFPEAVKGGAVANSATDLANYTLASKPLPDGTTITLDATQKIATITLPDEAVEKDDTHAVFTVANIKNIAGNKTVKSFTGTVAVEDNVKPVLISAQILDNKTIELTFNEAMQLNGTEVGNDFIIKEGTEAITLDANELKASLVSGFDKKVKITIAQGTDAPGTPAQPATAVAGGANSDIVEITDGDKATKDATLSYSIADKGDGTLEVKDEEDTVVETLTDGNGSFTVDGVTVTITGGADGNSFTVTTTAPIPEVPGTSETVLDLTKDITVETKTSTIVVDKARTPNGQKAKVKVTVEK